MILSSPSKRLWVLLLFTSHTSLSWSISFKLSPNWRCPDSFRSSAMNASIDLPQLHVLEWKWNLWMIAVGFGWKWFTSNSTVSAKVLFIGLAGARRFFINWYVHRHSTERQAALNCPPCLSPESTSPISLCTISSPPNLFMYNFQSSYCCRIRLKICVLLSWLVYSLLPSI